MTIKTYRRILAYQALLEPGSNAAPSERATAQKNLDALRATAVGARTSPKQDDAQWRADVLVHGKEVADFMWTWESTHAGGARSYTSSSAPPPDADATMRNDPGWQRDAREKGEAYANFAYGYRRGTGTSAPPPPWYTNREPPPEPDPRSEEQRRREQEATANRAREATVGRQRRVVDTMPFWRHIPKLRALFACTAEWTREQQRTALWYSDEITLSDSTGQALFVVAACLRPALARANARRYIVDDDHVDVADLRALAQLLCMGEHVAVPRSSYEWVMAERDARRARRPRRGAAYR